MILVAPVTPSDAAALPPISATAPVTPVSTSLSAAIASDMQLATEYKCLKESRDPAAGVRAVMVFSDPRDWYRDAQVHFSSDSVRPTCIWDVV
jgi:hypothetical protein